ncbi:hypothetical protein GBAR_LOCUS31814, partial [Geodia barretti]
MIRARLVTLSYFFSAYVYSSSSASSAREIRVL